ncbi:MAG: efflux RND transporter periplasmic adaptor subunit [Pseudomonadales bacterium]|nr:efflux RND transporter periplasmic adaptor subunit [Gammaproteobacteria bacterium]NNL57141.1 efflux RND transporter periplasmic adaptor subunit [Pseudomonadales bacterium]
MKKIANRYVVQLCLLTAPAWSIWQQPAIAEIGDTGNPEIPELDCVIEPSAIVDAGSSVPGLIETINVDRSDLIGAGDVLAKLESSVESAALKRARAQATTNTNIKLREESLKLGKITEQRNAELMQISAISKQDMEQLQTESRIAELQVKHEKHNKRVAQLEYERAKAALERLTIRSPIEGVVTDRFKAVGEYVEDEPVLRIAQIDPLFVEVVVPVDYLGAISAGMQAEVFPSANGLASHIATVERVDRVADAASGTYGVRLSLGNPDYAIPAGLRCKLAFLSAEHAAEQAAEDSVADTSSTTVGSDQGHWVLNAKTAASTTTPTTAASAAMDAAPRQPLAEAPAAAPQTEPVKPAAVSKPAVAAVLPANPVVETVATQSAASGQNIPAVDVPAMLLQAALATKDSPVNIPLAVASDKNIADAASAKADRNMCYSIGPVATERLAHQVVNQVSEHIQKPGKSALMKRLRGQKKSVTKGYYVLAKNGSSDQEVGAYLDRLNAAGVADHMLIDRGRNEGRISLGYFHRHSSAIERLQLMQQQGFDAEIAKLTGTTKKYWLDFNGPDHSELKANLQDIASAITPDASLQSRDCSPKVASR